MQHTILILLYFLLPILSINPLEESSLPTPPGGIKLQGNLYMDETEIANIHWLEYLYYLQKDSSTAHYAAALPDTTVWDEMDVTGYMKNNYLRSPDFRFHPVVGISYEQIQAYCVWRSAVASAVFNSDPKKRKKHKLKDHDVVFRWRLPSVEEWEMAAKQSTAPARVQQPKKPSGLSGYSIIDSLGNSRPDKQEALDAYLAQHQDTAVNCLKKFETGMYYGLLQPERIYPHSKKQKVEANGQFTHLIGNVAEMTEQKGVAKGGSWAHRLEQVSVKKVNTYDAPTAWLGARCIGEVYLVPRGDAGKHSN